MHQVKSKTVKPKARAQTFKCRYGCPLAFHDKTACLRHEWTQHINFKEDKGPATIDLTVDEEKKSSIEISSSSGSSDLNIGVFPGISRKSTKSDSGDANNKNDEFGEKGDSHKGEQLEEHSNSTQKSARPKTSFKCKICGEEVFNDADCFRHYSIKHPAFGQSQLVESQIEVNDDSDVRSNSDVDDSVSMRARKAWEKENTLKLGVRRPSLQNIRSGDPKIKPTTCSPETNTRTDILISNNKADTSKTDASCENSVIMLNVVTTSKEVVRNSETVGKKSVCRECGKSFSRNYMKAHARVHTGETFICEICKKSYANTTSLRRHMLSHPNENTFICDTCKKSFADTISLRRHKLVAHATEKTFICDICKKEFSHVRSLRIHQKIHKEKTLICENCNKAFLFQRDLTIHQRRHTGEKPFGCDHCSRKFVSSGERRQHVEAHHKDQVIRL